MTNQNASNYVQVQESHARRFRARRQVVHDLLEGDHMLGKSYPLTSEGYGYHTKGPFPQLDRAFDAVERALDRLGVTDPATLRSPRPVEEALSDTALPFGTLLVLDSSEYRQAEVDIEETVKDERSGGSVFVTQPDVAEQETRKRSLREIAVSTPTFCLSRTGALPTGYSRLHGVPAPESLADYDILLADTRGFRVALVRRKLPGGSWIGLWTGNEQVIAEVGDVVRELAVEAGLEVPGPASEVPPLEGVTRQADVWQKAASLRGYRAVREAELREIARQAALKGVAMRREREAKKRAAG